MFCYESLFFSEKCDFFFSRLPLGGVLAHWISGLQMVGTEEKASKCQQTPLLEGRWRGQLQLNELEELPFNFDLQCENEQYVLTLINGEERIRVEDVQVQGDSLIANFPYYNTQLRAKFNERRLVGVWYNPAKETGGEIDFYAVYGDSSRFITNVVDEVQDFTGRWDAVFIAADKTSKTDAIAEFEQKGTYITGTFLTPTGDYRYLEGTVTNSEVMLSGFDGAHAYLLIADIDEAGELHGDFYSGAYHHDEWFAYNRNQVEPLPAAEEITQLTAANAALNFSFPSTEGKTVSSTDDTFRNKVTIVQVMGSWCPNCKDETVLLTELYKQYHSKGLEVVALAFEPYPPTEAMPILQTYRQQLNVPYPVLLAGKNSKEEATKTLQVVNEISAFPTTFFVGRNGQVRTIHTGFSGPATSEYKQQSKRFAEIIEQLLNEAS